MTNKWFETDSLQWCKQIDNYRYKFCQVLWLDTTEEDTKAKNAVDDADNYCVVAANIDLMEYDENDVLMCLESYGYKGFDDVKQIYGDAAMQIIAECVFEDFYHDDRYVISKEVLSQADAINFVEKWKEEN